MVDGEQAGEGEEEIMVGVRKFPRTPEPWESLGSELEVDDESVVENRPKVSSAALEHEVTERVIAVVGKYT